MEKSRIWFTDLKIEKTLDSLRDKGFEARAASDREDTVSKILEEIPSNSSIGIGGSVTLRELNIPDILEDHEKVEEVADHWKTRRKKGSENKPVSDEEGIKVKRKQLVSDLFISSTNAITTTGELVNIDGIGQRLAAMMFGPKKVLIVAGFNKIVNNVAEGIKRARNIAAPMNAKRLDIYPPCTEKGECIDCNSEDRICNITSIMHRKPLQTNVKIILVKQKLGY